MVHIATMHTCVLATPSSFHSNHDAPADDSALSSHAPYYRPVASFQIVPVLIPLWLRLPVPSPSALVCLILFLSYVLVNCALFHPAVSNQYAETPTLVTRHALLLFSTVR